MQVMPATGAELKVGDITRRRAEHPCRREVHGPADDPVLQGCEVRRAEPDAVRVRELQRGPGNISKMRKEAEKRGLDPDMWFNNVEIVTAEKIGIETTTVRA